MTPERPNEGFIPAHGGYKNLYSYQKADVIYQATVHFVQRWIPRNSRTRDQMEQAARSGKQNIVEGSMTAATSREMEIKLTNVARASLEELLEDYRDFMKTKGLEEWPKVHAYAIRLRELCRIPGGNYEIFRKGVEHTDPAIAANVIIGLIRVASVLLDRQIRRLEQDFLANGGLRESMTRDRLATRKRDKPEDWRR
jgi:four helix bundle suffix protein